ncbi:SEC14-like protein 2 [Argiope bruennichi]|uniref:SEC14-like protein 2 like protein n=1 Tax=Argiope bruennichi TaxID=94029 RepID=A0A8T0FX50_ARGBR|nr:SEC14-like protein 2 [Argiope bruennichi]XP_055953754.1 SEC14-like protein 2 [Argiope bruennichi]XP_055953762.1 SEC14-like protein 2 [Argiope bruennichi]KAF8794825.1 SEC14-like protein 2 like protein [Argiope bruennichi]
MTETEDYSPSEKEAIEKLRKKVSKDLDKDLYEDSHQLYLMLKAQDFDLNNAENMLTQILKWRRKLQMEKIFDYKPPEVIENYVKKHKIGMAKDGSSVHYLPIGKYDSKGIYMSVKIIDLEKVFAKIVEEILQILRKQKKMPRGSYPNMILIFDMDQLTFANATDKKGLEYLIRILKVCQDYYPGIIKTIYIINVSSYFMIPLSIVKTYLSSSFISLAQLYGTDGWKEELLKEIDADQLPAFLGGTKTDPDGNPLCKTLISQAGKIDEKYYIHKSKNPLSSAPDVKKIVLARASFSEIELDVEEDGSFIEWEFETKTRDIGFGLFYKEIVDGEEKITELVPLLRINTEDYSETGVYKCEKAGTYIVLFDNSYSWIRSKEVYYRVKVVSPKQLAVEMQN